MNCTDCIHWEVCFNGKEWDAAIETPCERFNPIRTAVSCLDENGKFKSCPYRVYSDEHKAILRGQGDCTTQTFYPCMGEACVAYHCGVCLRLTEALKEVNK